MSMVLFSGTRMASMYVGASRRRVAFPFFSPVAVGASVVVLVDVVWVALI